jgi:hypothetical protein
VRVYACRYIRELVVAFEYIVRVMGADRSQYKGT